MSPRPEGTGRYRESRRTQCGTAKACGRRPEPPTSLEACTGWPAHGGELPAPRGLEYVRGGTAIKASVIAPPSVNGLHRQEAGRSLARERRRALTTAECRAEDPASRR